MSSQRILLISSNRCDQPYPVFPLALAHLESALRGAGHTTHWLDSQVMTAPLEHVLAEFQPHVVGVSLRNVDDVQFQSRQTYFDDAVELCRTLRQRCDCPIVIGGAAFSIFPEQLLTLTGADFGIHGPGEVAFNRLIEAIATGTDPSGIRGLVYRQGERVVINPRDPAEPVSPDIPERPAELVEFYLRQSSMLNIQTQRGCSLKCCYCTYPLIEGRQFRRRPPDAVAAELETIQRQGAKHVFITDSVFNTSAEHVADICEAILRRNVEIHWSCFLRPKNLTQELMALMARAGLTHIEFGTDSLCDSVLEEYGKAFTFDDVLQSSELARAAGVHQAHFLICGGPGENARDTANHICQCESAAGRDHFRPGGYAGLPGHAFAGARPTRGTSPGRRRFASPGILRLTRARGTGIIATTG